MKIAFIGLGAMGGPMASNIARKGTPITVYDISQASIDRVVEAGATPASSLQEAVSGAEIVITMLPATEHVLEVVAGPDGALAHMAPGGLLIDMSTIDPVGTDRLIESCAAKGIRFIDAPVGRLASHAIKGESLFMVGCNDEDDFKKAEPLFNAMGTTIVRCGLAGTGIRVKIVNNFQILSIAQITAEALVLGTKLGLPVETIKAVNGQTTANNGQMQVNFATKTLIGDIEPGFTFDLSHKDMTLALNAAATLRLGLPVGAAVHAVYGAARSTPYAKKDFTALLDYACEQAGIEPPRLTTAS
ncbi:NAD(P)-binding domain-containing protein [Achromobacter sp. F4_2707]|uniref:NAD(P)-dependent oxidoreductase n=1 Tax=Achromobacter sp. F4_2707 TaxID=3114286 RepID=UPI0039C7480F